MGKCILCGESAGLFKSKHSICEQKQSLGFDEIKRIMFDVYNNNLNADDLALKVRDIASNSYINEDLLETRCLFVFDMIVDEALSDGLLSDVEKEKIVQIKGALGYSDDKLDRFGAMQKLLKADLLQTIASGVVPDMPIDIRGNLPILINKNEKMIWVFAHGELLEQKTKRQIIGRSQGVSIRITKGVYYRTGAFKGTPIETTFLHSYGQCIVVLTNKTFYIWNSQKLIKIPYEKIISLDPYSDGIGIHKDGVTAKPIVIKGIDGWFTSNVINGLMGI